MLVKVLFLIIFSLKFKMNLSLNKGVCMYVVWVYFFILPVLDVVLQRNFMHKLDQPMSWYELKVAVTKLTNNKAPGLNKVLMSAFKALDGDNLT